MIAKLFILAALALPVFAQPAASKYLVEYSTAEKCYECGVRFAIGCLPDSPDCGVPNKAVPHFVEFATVKEALTFINLTEEDNRWLADRGTVITAKTFVRLLAFTEVALDKDVKIVEEPQPPKKIETVTYRHGTETGESPRAKSVWPSITCPDSSACSAGTSLSFGSIAVGSERIIPGVAK